MQRGGARLAFDPEGDPWVVGLHTATGEIVLYERVAGTWESRPAPDADFGATPRLPALAFQPDGEPTIAWIDAQKDLMVATRSGSLWPEETAVPGNVLDPPFGLGGVGVPASGDPRILYFAFGDDQQCARYVERAGAVWNDRSLQCFPTFAGYVSLVSTFREDGTPLAVTCVQGDQPDSPAHCSFRLYEGGTWRARGMPSRHVPDALDLDASGFAHAGGEVHDDLNDPKAPHGPSYWLEDGVTLWHEFLTHPGARIGRAVGATSAGVRILMLQDSSPWVYDIHTKTEQGWEIETVDTRVDFELASSRFDEERSLRSLAFSHVQNVHYYVSSGIEIVEPDQPLWEAGESLTARWRGSGAVGVDVSTDGGTGTGAVDVDLSTDGGGTWTVLGTGVETGGLRFVVPDAPGAEAVLRVRRPAPLATSTRRALIVGPNVPTELTSAGAELRAWPVPYRKGDLSLALSVPEDRGLVPVEVAVYDLRGRRVRSLIRGSLRGGDHDVTWNGRDEGGRAVASGVYFARARVGGEVSLTRLVVRR
jgi:hypothetical protein